MELKMKKSRDWTVELLRVIGCMIVIGVHTLPSVMVEEGQYSISRVFLSCVFGDGVTVFWLIMGFFLFSNYNYIKSLKAAFTKIFIPSVIFSILSFYFFDLISSGVSVSESINHPIGDYKKILLSTIALKAGVEHTSHLWYIFAYMLVIFISPVLQAFNEKLTSSKEYQNRFLILVSIFILCNDISSNRALSFSHHGFNAAVPASIILLYGSILYQKRECFESIRWTIISVISFIIINIIRFSIQYTRYIVGNSHNKTILYWYTLIGIANGICLSIFAFSLRHTIKNEIVQNIIRKLGKYTFTIYLIHRVTIGFLSNKGYFIFLQNKLIKNGYGNILTNSAYSLIVILTVFTISLVVSFIIDIFIKALSPMFNMNKKKC